MKKDWFDIFNTWWVQVIVLSSVAYIYQKIKKFYKENIGKERRLEALRPYLGEDFEHQQPFLVEFAFWVHGGFKLSYNQICFLLRTTSPLWSFLMFTQSQQYIEIADIDGKGQIFALKQDYKNKDMQWLQYRHIGGYFLFMILALWSIRYPYGFLQVVNPNNERELTALAMMIYCVGVLFAIAFWLLRLSARVSSARELLNCQEGLSKKRYEFWVWLAKWSRAMWRQIVKVWGRPNLQSVN